MLLLGIVVACRGGEVCGGGEGSHRRQLRAGRGLACADGVLLCQRQDVLGRESDCMQRLLSGCAGEAAASLQGVAGN